jgi:hypothetical protein
MKKSIALLIGLCAIALTPAVSFAGSADILTALQAARGKLVALIGTTDKGPQAALVAEVKAATKEVDAKVAATLADPATAADLKTKLTEFKSVWAEFQRTRDTEIIPAVLAGDTEKAKGLAQGIQVERFKKMSALLQ